MTKEKEWYSLIGLFGCENKSHDETVQSQHFSKDKDEDHTHKKPRLLGRASNTRVSNNTNGEASSQTTKANREACSKMKEGSTREGRHKSIATLQLSE
jgi:hypothetical protein